MACHSDKKRFRQDSSDPEAACQKCDKIITESVICQGCKLDYCVACAKISPTLFECLRSGEMNDFYWSCTSCRTTLPTLDNITGMLKDMQKDSNERMTRLETRVTSLESDTKDEIKGTVSNMKAEIISSLKDDINKLVDTRHGEMEERKRRESNIVIFNMPEHNFAIGTTNKTADEYDVKQISHHLGQESLNITNLFRLGKKVQGKTRVLKVILDSKTERRFLLENARHIEAKVPEKFKRVIISKDMTLVQRDERRTRRTQRRANESTEQRQNERSVSSDGALSRPIAMEIPAEAPSPIRGMPNLNNFADSQQNLHDASRDIYNNTTIQHDETIEGGFNLASSQAGLGFAGGQEDEDSSG